MNNYKKIRTFGADFFVQILYVDPFYIKLVKKILSEMRRIFLV
jgi:hypothetical protein